MKFNCTSLKSGEAEWGLWISVGFDSEKYGDIDVLHVVCGFRDDEEVDNATIYLERTDQMQGGYNLAERIELSYDAITVHLTREGGSVLEFASDVICFQISCPPEELTAARHIFTLIQAEQTQPVVHVA